MALSKYDKNWRSIGTTIEGGGGNVDMLMVGEHTQAFREFLPTGYPFTSHGRDWPLENI